MLEKIRELLGMRQAVKQRELDPMQRAILDELRRRAGKPSAKIYRNPDNSQDSFWIPGIKTLITTRPKPAIPPELLRGPIKRGNSRIILGEDYE